MRHEKKTHAAELLALQQKEQLANCNKSPKHPTDVSVSSGAAAAAPLPKRPRYRHVSSPCVLRSVAPLPSTPSKAASPPIIGPFRNMNVSSPESQSADLLSQIKAEDTDFLADLDVGSRPHQTGVDAGNFGSTITTSTEPHSMNRRMREVMTGKGGKT